ncbi:MAG: hypothetical protein EON57_07720 [Alphaproteobacteria bacterium]|nr:MAG: hypothetical protein EON57_07720 [Alphaproteobacteria bacterium]
MALKRVVTTAMAALLVTALGASANQPEVKVSDLTPMAMVDSSNAITLLMIDPWAQTDLRIEQVRGYATLDVDADPFVPAR